jgi:hypothetical protein
MPQECSTDFPYLVFRFYSIRTGLEVYTPAYPMGKEVLFPVSKTTVT